MNEFNHNDFDRLLSQSYLTETDKNRLRNGLLQFKDKVDTKEQLKDEVETEKQLSTRVWSSKSYTHFYSIVSYNYLLQGDLLQSIRYPFWNENTAQYEKKYIDALAISNTCDMSADNHSIIPKNILFAPLLSLTVYENLLNSSGIAIERIKNLIQDIKDQKKSNIFYLPCTPFNQQEYVVLLDELFFFPATELVEIQQEIIDNRIATLDYFGYYLFLLKLSYHLCRLPEDRHR
jgi:hypothetical protein